MKQWLLAQTPGTVMRATALLYVMFFLAAWAFGFDKVTSALGGVADRVGLTVEEAN